MTDGQDHSSEPPPTPGTQLGQIVVTLGIATQAQIDSALKTQEAQQAKQKANPDDATGFSWQARNEQPLQRDSINILMAQNRT